MDAKDITAETTECPICHEYYNDPKILPCAHILCRNCLLTWMKKTSHALCPLCRSSIVDSQDFSSDKIEDFVDCLPTDHAMTAMVEGVKIINQDHVCHVHGNVTAASICLHCNVMMCQVCVEVHRKLQITSSHKVESIQTLTLECLAKSRQEPCSVHQDKISELFCSSHNVLICQLCATSKHRTCPEVTNLQEMYEKYKRSLSELKDKLIPTISSLSQAMANIEEHILKSEQSMLAALAKIDESCDSILSFVENCRKRLKKLVQEADHKIKATILEQKSALSERRGRLTAHMYLIQRVQQMAHGSCLVAMVPKLENRIVKLDLDTSFMEETGQSLKRVTLTIDREAIVRMTRELEKLGDVVISSPSSQEIIINDTKKGRFGSCAVLKNKDDSWVKNNISTSPSSLAADSSNCVQSVHTNNPAMERELPPQKRELVEDKIEYEALTQLIGRDFISALRAIKHNPTKKSLSERKYVLSLLYSLKREDVVFSPVEMNTLRNILDVKNEGVKAFVKAVDNETITIFTFDYPSMDRAKHLLYVKCGRTTSMKCNDSGDNREQVTPYLSKSSSLAIPNYITKRGINISVYKADITQLNVDAIVNAANERLVHTGGVALAIARVAGHGLQIEGDEYIKTHGRLKVTDVVPTSSGNLPCKKVLHAVGPCWKDYKDKNLCQQHLAQTVFNCFLLAHKLHLTSLAMSSISSDIFGVPKDLCATTYLAAIQRFDYEYGPFTTLRDIHFVDISDDMVSIIQDTLTEKLYITVKPHERPEVKD